MKKLLLATTLLTSCTSADRIRYAYAGGATLKQAVEDTHALYDGKLNAKIDACDPKNNKAVTTDAQFDACLTDRYDEAAATRVLKAVEAYNKVASTLSELILIGAEWPAVQQKLRELATAAKTLIALVPGADPAVVDRLLRGVL
jgi:hypothetical protein